MITSLIFSAGCAFFALVAGTVIMRWGRSQPTDQPPSQEIASAVQNGLSILFTYQGRIIALASIILSGFIGLTPTLGWLTAKAFLLGIILSGSVTYLSIKMTARAHRPLIEAAQQHLKTALYIAFQGGASIGLCAVGLGLLGIIGYLSVLLKMQPQNMSYAEMIKPLLGLGLGSVLMAIFEKIGGGLFTQSTDFGASLMSTREDPLPIDDLRHPIKIATLIKTCFGTTADLFDTYVLTLIASMLLGAFTFPQMGISVVIYPLILSGFAILASFLGMISFKLRPNMNIVTEFYRSFIMSELIALIFFYPITKHVMKEISLYSPHTDILEIYGAAAAGLLLTLFMVIITEYARGPALKLKKHLYDTDLSIQKTTLLDSFTTAIKSTAWPVLGICASILIAYNCAGLYGIAIAATTMTSMSVLIIAFDSYGTIVDHAKNISKSTASLPQETYTVIDQLNTARSTTQMIIQYYTIVTTGLVATILFATYTQTLIDIHKFATFSLSNDILFIGLLSGGFIPYFFNALMRSAVIRMSTTMVTESRRQLKEIQGLLEGLTKSNYTSIIKMLTKTTLKNIVLLILLSTTLPILVGLLLGPQALYGIIVGTIITGLFVMISITRGPHYQIQKQIVSRENFSLENHEDHQNIITTDDDLAQKISNPLITPIIKIVNIIALLIVTLI